MNIKTMGKGITNPKATYHWKNLMKCLYGKTQNTDWVIWKRIPKLQ